MLNEVLSLLFDSHINEEIGKEATVEFAKKLIAIGDSYDCNHGEILEGFSERLNLCCRCLKTADNLENGLCSACTQILSNGC